MFEWLSTHRADISAIIILLLVAAFATSIYLALKKVTLAAMMKFLAIQNAPEVGGIGL